MVSAPMYVAQMQMANLRDPREQNRVLWAGYKLKTNKYEKYDTKNAENDSGAPGE